MIDRSFVESLKRYLREALHSPISIVENQPVPDLPAFLAHSYLFCEASIVGKKCLLMIAEENAATPTNISKHVSLVRSAADTIVIYVTPSLSAHNRSRLIKYGVSFIVPGNQLYVPELAMDLREHFLAFRPKAAENLSPAAQAVLFLYLLDPEGVAATPTELAPRLNYSSMSIGRAFDDLDALGLAKSERLGKERRLFFRENPNGLLELASPFLRTPVRSLKYVIGQGHELGLQLAGETALAELTDLASPRSTTLAIAANGWKSLAAEFSLRPGNEYEHDFVVEAWSYDPMVLSDGRTVDPLSLYAQFKNHPDERVSKAANSLLRKMPW